MEFRNKDPGAVQFGNFINYYSFHSASDRISLLPTHLWAIEAARSVDTYTVLDIGCNSGELTMMLYDFLKQHTQKEVNILGVDIDATLIQRAEERNNHKENITFICMDIMKTSANTFLGHLQLNGGSDKFDAIFCLSTTMWIHLNYGDTGLKKFLCDMMPLTELLVIEPQPWKCYLTAVKRMKKANDFFNKFESLEWRTTVEIEIKRYLEKECQAELIFETTPTKWNRKIQFYRKRILDYSVKLH